MQMAYISDIRNDQPGTVRVRGRCDQLHLSVQRIVRHLLQYRCPPVANQNRAKSH